MYFSVADLTLKYIIFIQQKEMSYHFSKQQSCI